MKRFLLLITFSLSIFASSVAQIIESDTVTEILKHLGDDPEHTLVIFDIDNTLAAPKLDIGTDQWFSYLVQQKMKEHGLDIVSAINAILPTYFKVQFKIAMHPSEEITPSLIRDLQTQGISVICLTARSIFIASRTLDQLQQMHIEVGIKDHPVELHLNMPLPCMYLDGVVFSATNDKGQVLVSLLNKIDFTPTKIIFLDDKLKNITAVETAMQERNIPFVGIRYSRLDERVENFDPQKAQEQWEILQQLLG